jgi:hypothetical protein
MDDCTWRMQMVWRMEGGWEVGAAGGALSGRSYWTASCAERLARRTCPDPRQFLHDWLKRPRRFRPRRATIPAFPIQSGQGGTHNGRQCVSTVDMLATSLLKPGEVVIIPTSTLSCAKCCVRFVTVLSSRIPISCEVMHASRGLRHR